MKTKHVWFSPVAYLELSFGFGGGAPPKIFWGAIFGGQNFYCRKRFFRPLGLGHSKKIQKLKNILKFCKKFLSIYDSNGFF